jgi:hypothetical protein
VASLLPLAIATHIATRSPSTRIETRAPRTEPAPNIQPAPIQIPPPRHQAIVICPIVAPCWQDGRPLTSALGGKVADP